MLGVCISLSLPVTTILIMIKDMLTKKRILSLVRRMSVFSEHIRYRYKKP